MPSKPVVSVDQINFSFHHFWQFGVLDALDCKGQVVFLVPFQSNGDYAKLRIPSVSSRCSCFHFPGGFLKQACEPITSLCRCDFRPQVPTTERSWRLWHFKCSRLLFHTRKFNMVWRKFLSVLDLLPQPRIFITSFTPV